MYCIVRVTDMDKIRTEEKTQTLVIFVTLPKSINSIAKICLTGDTIRRIDIVSRCFENINNNCCETKFVKMPFVYYYKLQIHDLATPMPGRPSHREARY